MKDDRISFEISFEKLAHLQGWVTAGWAETVEDVAFLSGVTLPLRHMVEHHPDTPQSLLRTHLALWAAEVSTQLLGRPERAGKPCDDVLLLYIEGLLQPVQQRPSPDGF